MLEQSTPRKRTTINIDIDTFVRPPRQSSNAVAAGKITERYNCLRAGGGGTKRSHVRDKPFRHIGTS